MDDLFEKLQHAKKLHDLHLIEEVEYLEIKSTIMKKLGLVESYSGISTKNDKNVESPSPRLGGLTRIDLHTDEVEQDSSDLHEDLSSNKTESLLSGKTVDGSQNKNLESSSELSGQTVLISEKEYSTGIVGTVFHNRYVILSELGKGGMGIVYRALDQRTGKELALKVILPEFKSNQTVIDSLVKEVALVQSINHINVIQVYHIDIEADQPYLIMELMDGDLEELLAANGGKLDATLVFTIINQILDALSELHTRKILHLDIKPSNILIKDKLIKISDFGISSQIRKQKHEQSCAGTYWYAPPEQINGEKCDVRADLYSVGILLYQLMVGDLPFNVRNKEDIQQWQ